MAVLEYTLPTIAETADGASAGSSDWTSPEAIKDADGSYTRQSLVLGDGTDTPKLRRASLILDDLIDEANNEAADQTVGALATVVLGGATDKWGQTTITPAQLRAATFGVALAYGKTTAGVTTTTSRYLVARGFNFYLPDDAVIDGVEVTVEHVRQSLGGGTSAIDVDYIKMKIYYTWTPTIAAYGKGGGHVYVSGIEAREIDKHFRHRVYDRNNVFVGEWLDDVSDPSFREDLNNPTSDMILNMARNELTKFPVVDTLTDEDDEVLLTEDDEELLVELAAATGLGEGSDMDLNYNYRLTAYYGRYEEELLEDGSPLLLENDELMLLEEGAPGGRDIFTGYLSYYETDWGTSDDLSTHILSHSHELNNIKLETDDTAYIDNSVVGSGSSVYFGTPGKQSAFITTRVGQSFTMAAEKKVSRISIRGDLLRTQNIVLNVYTGTTMDAGTLVAAATLQVTESMLGYDIDISIPFNSVVTLPAGSYHFRMSSDGYASINEFNDYPINLYTNNNAYAGGNLWKYSYNAAGTSQSWATQSPFDLRFKLWEPGGSTSVAMLSMDPTTMFRKVLDFAATRGARVTYRPEDMPPTGTVVSYTFNNMTVRKALDKILELMPADWFYRYDFGDNTMMIGPRPSEPDYIATLGADIVKLKLRRTMEEMINDVFYTGGGDPSLFVRVTDTTSVSEWRRALADISDNRVQVEATARLLAQVAIDAKKDPIYNGTITIGGEPTIDIEDIRPGMMIGFSGLGAHYDGVMVQLMSRSYSPDSIDGSLNTLPPKVAKRIEDIKRNLDAIEQGNAASSPS